MPVIIDENGQREVTQQEYDIYIASVSPTLQELKEYKIQELEKDSKEKNLKIQEKFSVEAKIFCLFYKKAFLLRPQCQKDYSK